MHIKNVVHMDEPIKKLYPNTKKTIMHNIGI
jgi:hypothetical protein